MIFIVLLWHKVDIFQPLVMPEYDQVRESDYFHLPIFLMLKKNTSPQAS